jgi:hypothetical protein
MRDDVLFFIKKVLGINHEILKIRDINTAEIIKNKEKKLK